MPPLRADGKIFSQQHVIYNNITYVPDNMYLPIFKSGASGAVVYNIFVSKKTCDVYRIATLDIVSYTYFAHVFFTN